jgi:hypothetical protein
MMRTLKFIVDGQIIKEDPACDFTGLVPGTAGYLKAEFKFSSEWDNAIKVVSFLKYGHECTPQLLKNGKSCTIPAEALTGRQFSIKVLGKTKDTKLTTNKRDIMQKGD